MTDSLESGWQNVEQEPTQEFVRRERHHALALSSPLLGDELSMPTKDGVGSDERSNFGKGASSDGFAADSEPATLIIGQPESSATELLLLDAVLFSEVFDNCILLTADPAGQGGYEDLPRLKNGCHRRIVARERIIRQLSSVDRNGLFFPGIGSAE